MRKCAGLVILIACLAAGRSTQAQSFAAFDLKPQSTLTAPTFSDTDIKQLLATLDRLIAAAGADTSSEDASTIAWQFARRLQTGRLTSAQESRVIAHLDALAKAQPNGAAAFAGPRKMIRELSVGKVAPAISGTDLDGKPFSLADYRGKVVVLMFSAEWCGICRAQAPYERFLLDRYANWPFAILGVETGSSRENARREHAADPVTSRAWWDAPQPGSPHGPIAKAWNVVGWPATYVIDGDGVIRFVDLRDEDLLKAVRPLVETQAERDAAAARRK